MINNKFRLTLPLARKVGPGHRCLSHNFKTIINKVTINETKHNQFMLKMQRLLQI